MDAELIAKYDARVPRYTSYPTAPHFHDGVDARQYAAWLAELPAGAALSLYLHVPFCDTLCWFCGCQTTVVTRRGPVDDYLGTLLREIALVSHTLGAPRAVSHLHLGGGSPTILRPAQAGALFEWLRQHFHLGEWTEVAVEIDPRDLPAETLAAFADAGMSRASIGVQDLDPEVQRAVNRIQPFETTRRCVGLLRRHGVQGLNIDLMYGLPHQTEAGTRKTVERVLTLEPDRVALFGYAHVPWMKRHQRLIPEDALPDGPARWRQFAAAAERLVAAGYEWIGLDHFARPDDTLAVAAREGRLRRNFQGYTTDDAPALLGLGASAIGRLPRGYVQNHKHVRDYAGAVGQGELPVARGVALSDEDRLRAEVIERLMCDLEVDLGAVAEAHGVDPAVFADALARLAPMAADGVVRREGWRVGVPEAARPLLRAVAAVFDGYLGSGQARHARAV